MLEAGIRRMLAGGMQRRCLGSAVAVRRPTSGRPFKRISRGNLQVWAKRPWARAWRWQAAGLGRPQMRAVAGWNHGAAFAGARLPHAPSLQRGFPLGNGSRAQHD